MDGRILAAAILLGLSCASSANAAAVSGFVGDLLGKKPIAGASVSLRNADGQRIPSKGTDANGRYELTEIQNGSYLLVVDAIGFSPQPHETITVAVAANKDVAAQDVLLWPAKANQEYFLKVSGQYAAKANKGNAKEVYGEMWNELRLSGVPPIQKQWLIKGVVEKDASAVKSAPQLSDYLSVDPKLIMQLQIDFSQAAEAGVLPFPTRAMVAKIGIPDVVLSDIVIQQCRMSRTPIQCGVFLDRFSTEWEGTPAAKYVNKWRIDYLKMKD